MKILRNIHLFLLIGLLFFGSVGVNVFAHFCETDGTSISFVVPSEDPCIAPVEAEPCCHEESTASCLVDSQKSEVEAPDCCSQQIWNYKIASDFQANEDGKELQVLTAVLPQIEMYSFTQTVAAKTFPKLYYDSPPPLSGKALLIRNQVFRL